ncbi:hypothetical protein [Fictibacillus fluitans]|uniref:Transposase n=1 Tax=Fictibacillus fluitans TaxID=3058422 RepID=A0ABT8HX53_9BACL|nr:hypothetical protein [Fictibacillus sp. NE201]MDN4525339.1 hypothetical protein [Fictibacillus sp. NE201]
MAAEKDPLLKQLQHPFYRETDDYRDEIKMRTLEKAAVKYPEPFNPESWTSDQLADHAMAENYDQSNYITGMRNRMRKLEQLVEEKDKRIADLEAAIREYEGDCPF